MYSPDGTQYYQPVTSMTAQATGPKITRTDRLEVCFIEHVSPLFYFDILRFRYPGVSEIRTCVCLSLSLAAARRANLYSYNCSICTLKQLV